MCVRVWVGVCACVSGSVRGLVFPRVCVGGVCVCMCVCVFVWVYVCVCMRVWVVG